MSYGSNLSSERFSAYLRGGEVPGRAVAHEGARDPTRWRDERRIAIPHRLFFGGERSGWGSGGVAFINPMQSQDHEALAFAYLVTEQQFQDVAAQEAGRPVGTEVDLVAAVNGGSVVAGAGRYDLVLHLGHLDEHAMFTFTTAAAEGLTPNPPGDTYRRVVMDGLMETHGLTAAQARQYVDDRAEP